jgi:hypothetical protein
MKKTESRQIDVYYCDFPGCTKEATFYDRCHSCGKVFCDEHKTELEELPSMTHFSTSGDTYCRECIANPPKEFAHLLLHYLQMRDIRDQEKAFYAKHKPEWERLELQIRTEKAEFQENIGKIREMVE